MTDFRVTLDDIEMYEAVERLGARDGEHAVQIVLERYFVAVTVEQE